MGEILAGAGRDEVGVVDDEGGDLVVVEWHERGLVQLAFELPAPPEVVFGGEGACVANFEREFGLNELLVAC